jgi:hypothetical protein
MPTPRSAIVARPVWPSAAMNAKASGQHARGRRHDPPQRAIRAAGEHGLREEGAEDRPDHGRDQ